MNIGEAIELCKAEGAAVRRAGWYYQSLYIFLDGTDGVETGYRPYLCLRLPDGGLQPGWTPSQEDLLAEDWELLP